MTEPTDGYVGHMVAYLAGQRWFAGKGRAFTVTGRRLFPWLSEPDRLPAMRVELVTVSSSGGGDVYQVPLCYYGEQQAHLQHALVGAWDEPGLGWVWAYDALHDKDVTGLLLRGVLQERRVNGLEFHCLDAADRDLDAPSLLLTAEQSNSSLAFGEQALLKVFRKLAPGRNPDIEIHEVLTQRGVDKVAALYGWIEARWDAGTSPERADLAMLQQFLRTATDGWSLALASVRDLYAEADLHADEVGGDFAGEAHRLGAATAEIHQHLADLLPTTTWTRQHVAAVAEAMRRRLDRALAVVPDLEPLADGLGRSYDDLAEVDEPLQAQRVHGDLHLGQTLRTVRGWKIIDFEGEPAKPLAERAALDLPLRDVAGMLRSFDYAAASLLTDHPHDPQIAYRAREWAQRNRGAFCDGYAEQAGADPRDRPALLRAYETDKAVYEAVYEARNRPGWLPLPLAALRRLAGDTPPEVGA